VNGRAKTAPRALTVPQLRQLRAALSYDEQAIARDLPDLVAFLMATGLRIGEACGLPWNAVDLQDGTVEVRAAAVRGQGLVVKTTKTGAGTRTLALTADRQALRICPQERSIVEWVMNLESWPARYGKMRVLQIEGPILLPLETVCMKYLAPDSVFRRTNEVSESPLETSSAACRSLGLVHSQPLRSIVVDLSTTRTPDLDVKSSESVQSAGRGFAAADNEVFSPASAVE
jgi:hypothetical protein